MPMALVSKCPTVGFLWGIDGHRDAFIVISDAAVVTRYSAFSAIAVCAAL